MDLKPLHVIAIAAKQSIRAAQQEEWIASSLRFSQ
jgi:hypothetical protein